MKRCCWTSCSAMRPCSCGPIRWSWSWSVVAPIQDAWAATPQADFPNYPAGSAGPAASDELLVKDGRRWLLPR